MDKETFKKTKIGQMVVMLWRTYKYPAYRRWLLESVKSHTVFMFKEYGPLNGDKRLYVINNVSKSTGLFYALYQVCRALLVAERYGLTLVVDWTDVPYFDQAGHEGRMNPFEYYFEPLSPVSIEDAMQSRNVTFYDRHTDGKHDILYGCKSEEEIGELARVMAKYLHIRKDVDDQLNTEIHDLLGTKKTLAVHVRGVEWVNVRNHPIPASLEEYARRIDEGIAAAGFAQIFLATDSEDTVAFFKERYKDRVVFYRNVVRAAGGESVLPILDSETIKKASGYRLGYEVLRDMLTLSRCDGLVAGLSYVSLAAEIFKTGRGETYEYKNIIELKLRKSGISVSKLPH